MYPLFVFSIQIFFICYFYCQKMAFVCEFQHTRLRKMTFFSRFQKSCKNLKSLNPYLLYKMDFLAPQNSAVALEDKEKFSFLKL
jgi:hypothetical protein